MQPLRIGTRGSALALAQARLVAALLDASPGAKPAVELVTIRTAGDRGAAGGDKSRWVLELERALVEGEIDLAVHSAKDVPGELADGLALLGAPPRAASEDVLCGAAGLEELPAGARVGTSSVRRAAQLRAAREDLEVVAIRGNVDTRLRKLHESRAAAADGLAGEDRVAAVGLERVDRAAADGLERVDRAATPPARAIEGLAAIVLARAGLQRLGREDEIGAVLDPARFVPSPGQGTLALEGRAGDERVLEAVQAIADERAFACLRAERAVARALQASCDTPLGAHALDAGCGCLHLRAWIGLPDGSAWVSDELHGGFYDPEELGRRMAERLRVAGAGRLLGIAEIDRLPRTGGGEMLV